MMREEAMRRRKLKDIAIKINNCLTEMIIFVFFLLDPKSTRHERSQKVSL